MSNSTVIAKHFVIAKPEGLKQSPVIARSAAAKQALPVDCFDSFARNDSFTRNDSFACNDE